MNTTQTRPAGPSGFRPEVQTLRAIAVLAVVLFHLWPTRLPGGFVGVDVFFVISGFLITAHLLRESRASGRIDLGGFWIRRIRRLLPAAFLVLVATVATVLLAIPKSFWNQYFAEIAASAVYVENWVLAADAVDYFAADQSASPVQHFWSLSAEEQFYLVWPLLLIVLLFLITKLMPRRRALVLGFGMAAVFIASLTYSGVVADEAFGYFSTFTHAWEFAAGGLLALALDRVEAWVPRHRMIGALAAWVGYALIGFSFFGFSGATPFPGTAALIPVVGTVFVIAAGTQRNRPGPDVLAGLAPVQWVGNVSYSLYLWHWAPIILLPIILARPLTSIEKIGILLAALALAAVTKRFVEDRFRARGTLSIGQRVRPIVAVVAATGIIAAVSLTSMGVVARETEAARADVGRLLETDCFGASSMLDPTCTPNHTLVEVRGPAFALMDTPMEWAGDSYTHCPYVNEAVRQCVFGPDDPEVTIAMVGDSHLRAYLPALYELTDERGWGLKLMWRAGCRPALPTYASVLGSEKREGCRNWRAAVGKTVADDDSIDLVITSGSTRVFARNMPEPEQQRAIADAFLGLWGQWTSAGTPVLVVLDDPVAKKSIPECIAASKVTEDPCARDRASALPDDPVNLALAPGAPDGVTVLDLTGSQCDSETCHFVVGGVITHYDRGHMTSTFVRSLEPYIAPVLDELVGTR